MAPQCGILPNTTPNGPEAECRFGRGSLTSRFIVLVHSTLDQTRPSPRGPEATRLLTFLQLLVAVLDEGRCEAGQCSIHIFRPALRRR
jgi:hypothetical protein